MKPSIAGEADDAQFLVEAAARGGYIAVVPRAVAQVAIDAGRLRVLATLAPAHAGLYAIVPNSDATERARQAVNALRASGAR